ncbi:MAG TPA: DUF4397 domain-containing protein [Ferruginibacter sp.]|nr:DUF4397 domain-containing protein [Ferruginibacter sp.]
MKKLKNVMGSFGLPILGLVLTVLLFSACRKDNNDQVNNTPAAGVMAFNLAVDKPAVGFSLSGGATLGNAPLNYTGYTGIYLPVYTGTREVRSFEYLSGSTIATSNSTFLDSAYYSAFLMGANGNYRNVVVKDQVNLVTPVAGKAWVRYVNAIPDSVSTVSVTIGANNETAPYATVSTFTMVDAGPVTFMVSNGSSINASRTITMEENKVYTVLLSGLPNSTDPEKSVQIKYIQNGTATQ